MNNIWLVIAQLTRDEIAVPQPDLTGSSITGALKLVFAVAGAVAVLIITIAGFKYAVSMGNPEQAAKAKNSIIYALIGLLVCLVAFSVVTFVLDKL